MYCFWRRFKDRQQFWRLSFTLSTAFLAAAFARKTAATQHVSTWSATWSFWVCQFASNLHPICISQIPPVQLALWLWLEGPPSCRDVGMSWCHGHRSQSSPDQRGGIFFGLLLQLPFLLFLPFELSWVQVAHSMKVVSLIKRQKPILSRHSRKIFIRHFKSCDKSAFPSTCTRLGMINVMSVSYAEFSGSFFILRMPSFAKRWVANHYQ